MMLTLYYACVVLAFSANTQARINKAAVINYLTRYGYTMEKDSDKSEEMLSNGLTMFQKFMGISANGKLSEVTKQLIESPRCGEPDIHPDKANSIMETIFKKKMLTYNIKQWTKWLPRTLQNQTVYNVLKLWGDDLSVKCKWSESVSDVNVIFEPDKQKAISMTGKVFTEVKYVKGVYTIYFYSTAARSLKVLTRTCAHAFGHVFGHEHSNLYSIMSPILRPNHIMANSECDVALTSAFTYLQHAKSYLVTSGNSAWEIIKGQYTVKFPPKKTSQIFSGVPDNYDSAFSSPDTSTLYFFKGSQYYRYDFQNEKVDVGYPNDISAGWAGVPDNIDAVISDKNFQTYFFKGRYTYLFNHTSNVVADGYPKPIKTVFNGLPDNIDAAFHYLWDGHVYFFKGPYYWIMRGKQNKLEGPYITKYGWRGLCSEFH